MGRCYEAAGSNVAVRGGIEADGEHSGVGLYAPHAIGHLDTNNIGPTGTLEEKA